MAIAELFQLLKQDPEGSHELHPPVDSGLLRRAEKILGKRLSVSFVRFLSLSNGATLFGTEQILGLGPELPESNDLIRVREKLLERGLPPQLIPFGPTEDGVDCLDGRARPVEGELPVVFWSPEEGVGEETHESFDEWLFELSEALRDGPPDLEALEDHTQLEGGDDPADDADAADET